MRTTPNSGNRIYLLGLIAIFWIQSGQATPSGTSQYSLTQNQKSGKTLSLNEAVRLAFEHNYDYKSQQLALRQVQIQYDTAWSQLYIPQINLQMQSGSNWTLENVPGTPSGMAGADPNNRARGYPASSIGLALGQYTLFNFYRDKIQFEVTQANYDRAQQRFAEFERNLRFQIEGLYADARINQDVLSASLRSVETAKAIYELMVSRKKVGKAGDDDVSSTNSDLLAANGAYEAANASMLGALSSLSSTLNVQFDEGLTLSTPVDFKPVRITPAAALAIFKSTGPTYRDLYTNRLVADLQLELAEKNRMPLPTVSFSGITLSYGNSYGANGNSQYANTGGPSGAPAGQLNVGVTLNLTLPILGPNGFLGSRTIESTEIGRDLAQISLDKGVRAAQDQIQQAVQQLNALEKNVATQKQIFDNDSKLLVDVFSKMSQGKATRLELRDAIREAFGAEGSYLTQVLGYYKQKLNLALLIGVDALPGEEGGKR